MTHSPSHIQRREAEPLLPLTHVPHAQPHLASRSGSIFRWFASALVSGGVSGTQGYFSVTSFVAKSTVAGGVFGAGALVCAGACVYCIYRVVIAIRSRDIQPIQPIADIAASKANFEMLRLVHSRLNTLLSETEEVDLEAGISDVQLHAAIGGQLRELEQILPQMREELDSLKSLLQTRSVSSPSTGGLDSPGGDSDFERGLLGRIDALSKKVGRDQHSRNSSRISSTTSSPAGASTSSFAALSPTASPLTKQSPTVRRITFGGSVNGGEGTPLSPIPGDDTPKK